MAIYRFDGIVVDRESYRIRRDGSEVHITPLAFDLLIYLLENRHRMVPKQELFENIWGQRFVSDNALSREVKEIRRALGDDARAPRFLATVHRRGYRFIGEVEPEAAGES